MSSPGSLARYLWCYDQSYTFAQPSV